MAYIARTNGTREEIPSTQQVTLAYAQKVVGGYVELVYPRASPNVIFLCNEDGHAKNLPFNAQGQKLYNPNGEFCEIVGDIIVMTRKEGRKWL